jgi:hypothetical protein
MRGRAQNAPTTVYMAREAYPNYEHDRFGRAPVSTVMLLQSHMCTMKDRFSFGRNPTLASSRVSAKANEALGFATYWTSKRSLGTPKAV